MCPTAGAGPCRSGLRLPASAASTPSRATRVVNSAPGSLRLVIDSAPGTQARPCTGSVSRRLPRSARRRHRSILPPSPDRLHFHVLPGVLRRVPSPSPSRPSPRPAPLPHLRPPSRATRITRAGSDREYSVRNKLAGQVERGSR
ncbi:hypothetical protein EJB05_56085, partial [Eragrostis curvula]